MNRDKDKEADGATRRRRINCVRRDIAKPLGQKTRDKRDDDTADVVRDNDKHASAERSVIEDVTSVDKRDRSLMMTRERRASLTGNVAEFRPGQLVFPVYPLARPVLGVVVGANRVEGKVYVSFDGKVSQHDPDEVMPAAGAPFFYQAGGRVAADGGSKTVDAFMRAVTAIERNTDNVKYAADLTDSLVTQGMPREESVELARCYTAAAFGVAQLSPVVPQAGEPVVLLNDGGRRPGRVGVLVAVEGDEALVDSHTSWTSRRDGCVPVRVPLVTVVPVETPARQQLSGAMVDAVSTALPVAKIGVDAALKLYVTSLGALFSEKVFNNERGEACVTVQGVIDDLGPRVKVRALGRERGVTQTLYDDTVAPQVAVNTPRDLENLGQRVKASVDNARGSAYRFVRDRLYPDFVEQDQRRFVREHA